MLIHKYTVHLSRGPEVGGRKRDRRKEGGLMKRRHFIYFYDKMAWFLYRSFKLLILGFYFYFYSLKFYSWRTGIDGHSESRRFYRDMTSLVCLTVHLLLYKDIFLKYCFCTRAKIIPTTAMSLNTAQAPYKTATNTNNLLYRLLYIVQPGVFTHDCSVLLTAPPLRQIYTRKEKERKSTQYTRCIITVAL